MTTEQYIKNNERAAIAENIRSGVPASITIAQGILESDSGNSRLARASNNHFGIKCHGDWEGQHVLADDDAPQECFRKYNSVRDSYRDHSDFLKKNSRYNSLFKLAPDDWMDWAIGLQKAGYATSKTYARGLANIIQRYRLDELDRKAATRKILRLVLIPAAIVILAVILFLVISRIRKKKLLNS